MSTSSLPEDYSITLNDTISIDTSSWSSYNLIGANTVTITSGAAGSSYHIGSSDTITLDTSNIWNSPREWDNSFPEWDRIQEMCKHYPSLEIALRNFKVIYELVKDDYDNPVPKK